MLKTEHVKLINQIRRLLNDLENASLPKQRSYPYGKFAEACTQAEAALERVLLIAQYWIEPEISKEEAREEEPV